jgi:hypothetical protein
LDIRYILIVFITSFLSNLVSKLMTLVIFLSLNNPSLTRPDILKVTSIMLSSLHIHFLLVSLFIILNNNIWSILMSVLSYVSSSSLLIRSYWCIRISIWYLKHLHVLFYFLYVFLIEDSFLNIFLLYPLIDLRIIEELISIWS